MKLSPLTITWYQCDHCHDVRQINTSTEPGEWGEWCGRCPVGAYRLQSAMFPVSSNPSAPAGQLLSDEELLALRQLLREVEGAVATHCQHVTDWSDSTNGELRLAARNTFAPRLRTAELQSSALHKLLPGDIR